MKIYYLLIPLFIYSNLVNSQQVLMNEFCADNTSIIADANGEFNDWIELYNKSSIPINLFNYSLSDDENELRKWIFPDVEISANGYLLIFASGQDSIFGNELHTNFKIKTSGETIILSNHHEQIIDLIEPIQLAENQSFARILDGNPTFGIAEIPTPNSANNLGESINFSHPSGYYADPFLLTLSVSNANQKIYYTLNGDNPTSQDLLYWEPIIIEKRTEGDFLFSAIPTTPLDGNPILNDFVWKPSVQVQTNNVVRFAAFENGEIQSPIFTKNYFIGNELANKYSFPVINITSDSLNLFGFESGIYIPGKRFEENGFIFYPEGNYLNEGRDWERDAHISYFEKDGKLGFESNVGIRMHGNGSTAFPQKSFKIYFRNEYGQNELDYPIFPNSENQKFKRLLFRNGGNDFLDTHFKDAFLQNVIGDLDLDLQKFQPSIVFINGEYWGIHNIREKYDRFHFQNNFGIDKEEINVLKVDGRVEEGDNTDYLELIDFVEQNDLSINANYRHIAEQVNLSNFIDFQISEIYFANYDWPCNNYKIWKGSAADSRWRYAIYDLDYTFGFDAKSNYTVNSLEHATSENDFWPHCLISNTIFRNLLKNEEFKKQFLDRFLFCLKNNFNSNQIIDKIHEFESLYQPEMQEHIDRWQYPPNMDAWRSEIQKLKEFARERPCYIKDHIVSFFDLEEFDFNCKKANEEGGTLEVFPNPSNGNFTLTNKTYENLTNLNLNIFNFNGQIVFSGKNISIAKNEDFQIRVIDLPFGMYFLELKNEKKLIQKKILISSN